jgi:hypothetical protein
MLVGILADIHDAVEPLKASLVRFRELGVEQVVLLGDAFETLRPGEPGPEVARLLREAGAVGVWGNHDVGLSHDIPEKVRKIADPALLDFTLTLRPQLTIDNCRFSHVEPWLNPTVIKELWHYDGQPESTEMAERSFNGVNEQFIFVGHYHCWAAMNLDGPLDWDGTEKISFASDQRYFVIMAPVVHGWSAVFDSNTAELYPILCPSGA